MFPFESWIESVRARVERVLLQRISGQIQTPLQLKEAMAYSLLGGGKRLRPILCVAFSEAVGQQSQQLNVLEDAIFALESVHTYSLIHDDLPSMDNDDLRRGQPTSHKKFGEAMAILAGDALLTDAFSSLANGLHVNESKVRLELVQLLASASGSFGMVGGQVLDIDENRPGNLDYLKKLHRLKTGVLIEAACSMGVACANGSTEQKEIAKQYGSRLGLAFQIADDVLDVTSSSEVMGKPTKADAARGRHTFPAILGLNESIETAKQLIKEAIEFVKPLEPTGGPLTSLADYVVSRNK
jgi:geranylgeranyl diphosphate synthase, type II